MGRSRIIAKKRATYTLLSVAVVFRAEGFYAKLSAFRACLTGFMLPLSPSLLATLAAACLYAAATLYQGTRLANGAKANKRLLVTLGVLAVLGHAASLYTHLMTPIGLGLDFSTPPA